MPTDRTRNYVWKRKRKSSSCARGSLRVLKRGKALVRVCCPKRKFSKRKRCKVSMVLQAIGKKR